MKKVISLVMILCFISIAVASQMNVHFVAGPEWNHTYWFMKIIPVKLTPQIAVWTANNENNLQETLFVTEANSKINRKEALPYWSSLKSKEDMQVTSATPKNDFSISWEISDNSLTYIYAEVNNSFDYNENYPKQKGNVDGQPALIYRGEMTPDAKEIILQPYGISSNNKIIKDLSSLTSCLDILSEIKVVVNK